MNFKSSAFTLGTLYFSLISIASAGPAPASIDQSASVQGEAGGLAGSVLNMALHGAHHVPLQMQGAQPGLWVTSDYARNEHYDSDLGLFEIGVSEAYYQDQLIAGFGVGQAWVDQDRPFGGEVDMDGQYILGELSYRPTSSQFVYTFTGTYGTSDADIVRGHAGGPSAGSTDIDAAALRFRVDWLDATNLGGFSISPKLEYSYYYTDVDGYSETGGVSPATYSDQSEPSHQIRYGLTATREVCETKGLLRLRAEGVYRVDGGSSQTSGTSPISFSFQGPVIRQHWLLLGADFDYELSETMTLTSGLSTATSGDDPTIGATVGLRMAF